MKKDINSIQYLPLTNGVWLCIDNRYSICWYIDHKYITLYYSKKEKNHHPIYNLPYFRAFYYLFQNTIQRLWIIKKIKSKIDQKYFPISKKPQIKFALMSRVIYLVFFIVFFAFLTSNFDHFIISQNINPNVSFVIIAVIHFVVFMIFMLLSVFAVVNTSALIQFLKYHDAIHQVFIKKTTKYKTKPNCQLSRFIYIVLLSVFIKSFIHISTSNTFSDLVLTILTMSIVYAVVYELYNYCQTNRFRYICYLFLYPSQIIQKNIKLSSTPQEQKVVKMALAKLKIK